VRVQEPPGPERSTGAEPGARPPWWAAPGTVVGAIAFVGTLIVWVPYTMTGWDVEPPFLGVAALRWLGVALIVLPVPVLFDFLVRFVGEGFGTPIPIAPPQRLVVGGTFRFVRNPGYLAALLVLLGQALYFGSTQVLAYALVMGLVLHLFVVTYEEPTLRRMFGADYEAYCRRVGRWLPRPPRGA
jgi:protein-S-isoprenylcysteine O-methyltransferase Ste14